MQAKVEVKIEDQSSVEKKIHVQIPEKHVLNELDAAYKDLKKQVKVPGFRQGKVPRNILEKQYGPSLEAKVYQNLVREGIAQSIEDHKLRAVNVRDITDPKRDNGFSYSAIIEIKPQIELKKYKGLKVSYKAIKVGKKELTEALDRVRESQSVLQVKEKVKKPKTGDFAAIKVQSLSDIKEGEDKPAQERIYEIGAKGGQEVLDKALLGMQVGDSQEVTFNDKKNNKDITVKVSLDAIKEKVLPELSDDFAKSIGSEFKTLADLESRMQKDLEEEAVKRSKGEKEAALLAELRSHNALDIPPTLLSNEIQFMLENIQERIKYTGVSPFPEDYTSEKIKAELTPEAEKTVHNHLLIEAIAEKESITVDDKAFNQRIAEIAKTSKVPTGELKAYYEKTGRLDSVRFEMLSEKTLELLLEDAKITEK